MKLVNKAKKILKRNKYKFKSIGKNVEINRTNKFYESENIEIGNNVYIGFEGLYIGYGGIKIGDGSIFAHRIEIMTKNHNYDGDELASIPYDKRNILKPIIIGENVWVGASVKIVPGVTIGEGAVIGMGAVVTRDVPPFAIIGGNPAKVIKYRNIEKYKELKSTGQIYLKLKK